jgi:gliding motility-associated-like protein
MKKLIVILSLLSNYAFANKTSDLQNAQKMMQKSSWAFEENKGQVTGSDAKNVKFVFKEGNLSMFLMQAGIAYQFHKVTYPEGYKPLDKFASAEEHERMEKLQSQIQTETYRMDVHLEGANPNPKIKTEGKSDDYIQYYNHNALDVRSYQKVTYYEVYPNIDWVVYINKNAGINEPKVKYDFIVHPGGDPSKIKLKTEWVEELTSNADGSITLNNKMGSVTEQPPVSFQDGKTIETNFVVNKETISFYLENFDNSKDIIIDPGLVWATYYGGSANDQGYSCATDGSGNVYLAGWTLSTNNISSGGHQNTLGGATRDAFLVKFNGAGVRQWATYYGGSNSDQGYSCATDGSGNVYLAGWTISTNNISSGGHQNTFGGGSNNDAFLVKFNGAGVRQWATYYGGSSSDIGYSCATDGSGNVYLAGWTISTNNISSGGHQNTLGGTLDAFLVKFNGAGVRQWATYYGGSSSDYGYSCATDGSGNVYLAGHTTSTNNISSGGHQNTLVGTTWDAFLVKFNGAGVRQWATYYGGSANDQGFSCATDGSGNIYLAGMTNSTNNIASGGHQNTLGGANNDAFLVKFNGAGVRQWATYYGGSNADGGFSCATDGSGNIYLAGLTNSTNNIASGGHQNTLGGGSNLDAFLVKFNGAGVRQWATYYGGSANDEGYSCATDGSGNVYLAGFTLSTNNISSGGHQNTFGGGGNDAFLVKFNNSNASTFNIVACSSYYWAAKNKNYTSSNNTDTVKYTNITGIDSIVTLNLTINPKTFSTINQTICQGTSFLGRTTSGTYIDTLIGANSKGCDSIRTLILTVNNPPANLIAQDTIKACGDSVLVSATSGLASYSWSNGKTTASFYAKATGWYKVTATNSAGCAGTDSIFVSILNASILQNDTTICAGMNFRLSVDSSKYNWNNQVYISDFENNSLVNFTNGVINTYNGSKVLGRFSTELVKWKLQNLPAHDSITFDFDLLIHDSWDGNVNPDLWKLTIDNTLVYSTSFNNHNGGFQSYPGNYPSTNPSMTGAFATNLPRACFPGTYVATSLYKIKKTFTHTLDSISVLFKGDVSQDICDESWSLDNLKITLKNKSKYSILWSTGDTTASINLAPSQTTKYWVRVSNGSHFCTDTVTVTVSTPPSNLIAQDTIKACGDSVLISATSGLASYSWSNGKTTASFFAKSTGWYKVTATNSAGCPGTDSVFVSIIKANILNNDTAICLGQTVKLNVDSILGSALLSSCAPLPSNLQNGLVGYWPFCGNANDMSGNGNNGIFMGNALFSSDRNGNTNNSYIGDIYSGVDINNINNFPFGNSARTISIWFQNQLPYSGGNRQLFAYGDNNSGGRFGVYMDGLNIGVEHVNGGRITSYIPDIYWHNIIVRYPLNGAGTSSIEIYFDGILKNSSSFNPLNSLNTSNSYIHWIGTLGFSPGWLYAFNGKLDDIAIWNRALSPQEIQQLYNSSYIPKYLWSTGDTTPTINVTPSVTTKYWVRVSNGSHFCTDTVTVTVNNPPANLIAQDTIKACGDSVLVSATSGLASYSWSNGKTTASFFAKSTGWYKVTATNSAGCPGTDSVFVSIIKANILNNDTAICAGQSVKLSVDSLLAGAQFAQCAPLPSNLQNGLVGFWPFCGNANDVSGNGNNGTVNGATLTADRFGNMNNSYIFNGVSNKIEIPATSAFDVLQFTISYWLNTNSSANQHLVSKSNWSNAASEMFCTYLTSSQICFEVKKNSSCVGGNGWNKVSSNLPSNFLSNWHLLTYSYDGTNMKFYLNGTLLNSSTLIGPIDLCSGGQLKIGAWWSSHTLYYSGKIDDMSFWNRALNSQEIQQLYTPAYPQTYLWSTGDTTPAINVTPSVTTKYWVRVSNGSHFCTDTFTVTVNTNTRSTINQTICQGQSLLGRTVSGVYIDTLIGANNKGCDSIRTLILTVNDTTKKDSFRTICKNYPVLFNGLWINNSGTYKDTLVNTNGCDSFLYLHLTVNDTTKKDSLRSICRYQPITFNGQTINTSGVYRDTLVNSRGCDSFLYLILTVNDTSRKDSFRTICKNQSLVFNGNTLNTSGTYRDTLVNARGCDSFLVLHLTVNDTTRKDSFRAICRNQPIVFNGQTINTSGVYRDTLINAKGCDSFLYLILTVNDTTKKDSFRTICKNYPVLFNGLWINNSGTYKDTLVNAYGCDSFLYLHLTVNDTTKKDSLRTICKNYPVLFNGLWRNNSGTYKDTLVNAYGCDSFLYLHLTVNDTTKKDSFRTICKNHPVLFNGLWINNSGTYKDTLVNANGCDSFIYLYLKVDTIPISNAGINKSRVNCAGDSVQIGTMPNANYAYSWSPNLFLSDNNTAQPWVKTQTSTNYILIVTDNNTNCQSRDTVEVNVIANNLDATKQVKHIRCFGENNGEVTIKGINGYTDYSYKIGTGNFIDSGTYKNLAPGIIPYTVKDSKGCLYSDTFLITEPLLLKIDTTLKKNILCYRGEDGEIQVLVSGGNNPYNYNWSSSPLNLPKIGNLKAGTYHITITDKNGCIINRSFDLIQPDAIKLGDTLIQKNICNGDSMASIDVSIIGGVGQYEYIWSNGDKSKKVTNLKQGHYSLTVTDSAKCTQKYQFSIMDYPKLIFDTILSLNFNCDNEGAIILSAKGGLPNYSYSIDSGINFSSNKRFKVEEASAYQVQIKDNNGCIIKSSTKVRGSKRIEIEAYPKETITLPGEPITLGFNYTKGDSRNVQSILWKPSDGLSCTDCANPIATPYTPMQYSVTIFYNNLCSATEVINIRHTNQNSELFIPNSFFPESSNPENQTFKIYSNHLQKATLKIFNRWGEKVFESNNAQNIGWDGTYKGEPMKTAVYIYWAEVTYLDGRKVIKSGDLTLIR